MMTPLRFASLVLACAVSGSAIPQERPPATPTATELIEGYLGVRGGREALDRLRYIERIGWIAVDAGDGGLMAGNYHTCMRYPDRVAIEIDAAPWRMAQVLRAEGALECGPGFSACQAAKPDVAQELRDTARFANKDLLDRLDAWRSGRVSAGNDGASWKITIAEGRWAAFDRATGHLRAIGHGERWRQLGQWREISGVTLPHRLEDFVRTEDGRAEWRNTVQLRSVQVTDTPSEWCSVALETDS